MRQPLPAGLDPVTAGRLGLWLLGQRSHRRAQRRTISASRVPNGALGDRFLCLYVPWKLHEYPGRVLALSELLGVPQATAKRYTFGRLPTKHAVTLARIAREREAAWRAVAEELEGKSQGF